MDWLASSMLDDPHSSPDLLSLCRMSKSAGAPNPKPPMTHNAEECTVFAGQQNSNLLSNTTSLQNKTHIYEHHAVGNYAPRILPQTILAAQSSNSLTVPNGFQLLDPTMLPLGPEIQQALPDTHLGNISEGGILLRAMALSTNNDSTAEQYASHEHNDTTNLNQRPPSYQEDPRRPKKRRRGSFLGVANAAFGDKSPSVTSPDMIQDGMLHNSCKLYAGTFSIVESALKLDTTAVSRSVPTNCTGLFQRLQTWHYPLHIALMNNASVDVIQLLVGYGPDVTNWKDGPECMNALATSISNTSRTADETFKIVHILISANKGVLTRTADHQGNLPLHLAIRFGQPLSVVKILVLDYPGALHTRNNHGNLPLDVCRTFCGVDSAESELALDFLQSICYHMHRQGSKCAAGECLHQHDIV